MPDYHSIRYSDEDSHRVPDLFATQVFFLILNGLVIPEFPGFPVAFQQLGREFNRGYCLFLQFLTLHITLLYTKTTLDDLQYGELEDITDGVTLLVIYAFATFAIFYWTSRTGDLKAFLQSISNEYEHHSLPGITYVSGHQAYAIGKKLTTYWFTSCVLTVSFWALTPLLLRQRGLPLNCWYPFDAMEPYAYEIVYVLQFLAQVTMGTTFANGGALYVSTILILMGQFDVLFCSLKNVQYHAKILAGGDINLLREKQDEISLTDDELNQYIICKEHKVDMRIYASNNNRQPMENLQLALQYSMKRCILHHQFILRSCAKLEELFNPYCLIKSLQITVQLCLLVFIGVVGDRSIVRSMNLVGYLALTSVELLMFTYYGELLRSHSLRAGEALLRSPWHKNSPLIKREILIFLANTKKPVQLTAGKFFVMNVDRLRSVVAQAFSFLTLLQKIAAKKP